MATLRHIIVVPSQPVVALTPSGEATNTYFIAFMFDLSDAQTMIYRIRFEHAYHWKHRLLHGPFLIHDLLPGL